MNIIIYEYNFLLLIQAEDMRGDIYTIDVTTNADDGTEPLENKICILDSSYSKRYKQKYVSRWNEDSLLAG